MSLLHYTLFLTLPTLFFFFNDTATTEIYTLSLHDALPISLATPSFVITMARHIAVAPDVPVFSKPAWPPCNRSEEHTSELQSQSNLVCRLLLEKKKQKNNHPHRSPCYKTCSRCLVTSLVSE